MEPTNHPFRKENDLPNLHDYVPCYSSGVYLGDDPVSFWCNFSVRRFAGKLQVGKSHVPSKIHRAE